MVEPTIVLQGMGRGRGRGRGKGILQPNYDDLETPGTNLGLSNSTAAAEFIGTNVTTDALTLRMVAQPNQLYAFVGDFKIYDELYQRGDAASAPARPIRGARYNPEETLANLECYRKDLNKTAEHCYKMLSPRGLGCYRNESNMPLGESTEQVESESDGVDPKALEQVFKYLDLETLGTCRLVCKTWNETVIPIYSQHIFTFGEELYSSLAFDFGLRKNPTNKFYKTMISSPIGLVKKVSFDNATLKLKKVQDWFTKYGDSLTSLWIRGPFNEFVVRKILIQCTNLEFLEIRNIADCPLYSIAPHNSYNPVFEKPFKLKAISLTRSQAQEHFEWMDTQVAFVCAIIANSPCLESLNTSFGDKSYSFTSFVERLSIQRNITENLIEWEIGSHSSMIPLIRSLAPVTAISFSNRLKRLKIVDVRDQISEGTSGLMKILSKVATSLETLILGGPYILQMHNNPFTSGYHTLSLDEIQLPRMENLKTFENWSTHAFRLYSLLFLEKFPNLDKLVLGGYSPEEFTHMLMGQYLEINKTPHLKLRELQLVQAIVDARVLSVVSRLFPNLTRLTITIGAGLLHVQDGRRTPRPEELVRILSFVAAMKGIKSFGMKFLLPIPPDVMHVGIVKGFRDLESLQELTLLGHSNCSHAFSKQEIHFQTLKEGILLAKNLRTIRMKHIVMEVSGARKLFDFAKSRGVKLDFDSDEY